MGFNIRSVLGLSGLAIIASIAIGIIGSTDTFAATKTWTGSVDNLFSTTGNWSPSGAPVNGDDLIFPHDASGSSSENDIAGLSVNSIALTATGAGNDCLVVKLIEPLTINGSFSASKGCKGTVRGNVILGGDVEFSNIQSFTPTEVATPGSLNMNGHRATFTNDAIINFADLFVISGQGTMNINSPAVFNGSNTFSGIVNINANTSGLYIDSFGTAAINVNRATLKFEFAGPVAGEELSNIINITSDENQTGLSIQCSGACAVAGPGTLSVSGVILNTNSIFDLRDETSGAGLAIDLDGIVDNDFCLSYAISGVVGAGAEDAFLNGPDACKSEPGAPDTGVNVVIRNAIAIVVLGIMVAIFIILVTYRRAQR